MEMRMSLFSRIGWSVMCVAALCAGRTVAAAQRGPQWPDLSGVWDLESSLRVDPNFDGVTGGGTTLRLTQGPLTLSIERVYARGVVVIKLVTDGADHAIDLPSVYRPGIRAGTVSAATWIEGRLVVRTTRNIVDEARGGRKTVNTTETLWLRNEDLLVERVVGNGPPVTERYTRR
jgi:hypothetical protein